MEDLKKLDRITEFKLTDAIQKAASMALASDQDRSEILAKQLTESNVPKELTLTKTATQAFNRRISVVTIGKRPESEKAEDFPLADFNKVASIRGCEEGLSKAASVNAPFVFEVHKAELKKVASVPRQEQPVKEVTPLQLLQRLEDYMIKEEAAFQEQHDTFLRENQQLERMVKRAAEMLSGDVKTAKLLATVYGDTYNKLFTGKVPEEALKKHAAYAILPKSSVVEYVEKTIQQSDIVDTKRDLLMMKTASVRRMAKEAVEIEGKLKKLALCKEAVSPGYTMFKDIAANAVSVPINALLAGTKGVVGQSESILGQSAPFLNPSKGYSPEEAISLQLLSKDKYQDKRMRLIDMLANPDFAQYPAAEIEKAVEDTIATNPDMASPRMREYLKAEVASRLLAGNRTNKADLAATADILKKVTETEKERKELAPETVASKKPQAETKGKGLSEVLPSISGALANVAPHGLLEKDLDKDFDAVLDKIKADKQKQEKDYEDRRREEVKATEAYIKQFQDTVKKNLLNKANIQAARRAGTQLKFKGKPSLSQLDSKQKAALLQSLQQYYTAHPERYQQDVLLGKGN